VNYPYDRDAVAEDLGMAPPIESSLDAVSDRDFAMDLAHACTVAGVHLSRFGGELVLWSTREFGFARLPEGYSSGSSIMPQKRNPDAAEIVRGKAHALAAGYAALAGLAAGLPLGYSKDLQDDKPPVMAAVETLDLLLRVATGVAAGVEFDRGRMREAALDPGLYAVDLADDLVATGVPFRQAHEAVGTLMRHLADHPRVALRSLGSRDLAVISPHLAGLDPASVLDPARSLARRRSVGSPSRASMKELLAVAGRRIEAARRELTPRTRSTATGPAPGGRTASRAR
jgi:argininosuccinate lyase